MDQNDQWPSLHQWLVASQGFVPGSNTGISRENQVSTRNQPDGMLLTFTTEALNANSFYSEHTWHLYLWPVEVIPYPPPVLKLSPKFKWGLLTSWLSASLNNSPLLFLFDWTDCQFQERLQVLKSGFCVWSFNNDLLSTTETMK